jgi:hypothetical protein
MPSAGGACPPLDVEPARLAHLQPGGPKRSLHGGPRLGRSLRRFPDALANSARMARRCCAPYCRDDKLSAFRRPVMSSSAAVPGRRHIDASPALTRALAIFVALHGIAHVAGTSDSFTTAADGESVDYLAGAWTIADPTLLRVLGVLWVLLGAAFVVAAVAVSMRRPNWPRLLGAVALVSLAVVVVAVWSSTVGVAIDVALLVVAVRAGALRHPEAAT